jgi:hypothetical protein
VPAAAAAGDRSMPWSYRVWWLIAFCALGIGLAIEADAPASPSVAEAAVAAPAAPAAVAAGQRAGRGV